MIVLGPRLALRQTQSLVMTPQLRQAIKLLQLNNIEAASFVQDELERNPLLEPDTSTDLPPPEQPAPDQVPPANEPLGTMDRVVLDPFRIADMPADERPDSSLVDHDLSHVPSGFAARPGVSGDWDVEDFADAAPVDLRAHLGEQLRLTVDNPVDRMIGAALIVLLCPAGRLTATPQAIATALAVTPGQVEQVRTLMMRFDPTGVFARDLRECLAVQLAERSRLDRAMTVLVDNLDLLARRDFKRLRVLCQVPHGDLAKMIAELRTLDPKPGARFGGEAAPSIVPDVLMHIGQNNEFILELNSDTLPRVLVNHGLFARVVANAGRPEKSFLAERLQSANWLVRSLQQRAATILRVSQEIVRQQEAFFRHGAGHLRPLVLRDIAAAVDLHESTISRVTANKYIATPRGVFELKYFFTIAIAGFGGAVHSAETVRQRIKAMILAEEAGDILSDDALVAALRQEGVDIARRTVAKYREAMQLPSSVQRKRDRSMPA